MVQFHFARFYKPEPRSIQCMSLNRETSRLALSRSDNSIEVWNLVNAPFIERIIPKTIDQHIQELAWFENRLFSCDLQGFLNEYDLLELKTKCKMAVTGEAAYCLDVDKQGKHIAIGTEQGYVNIFSIAGEDTLWHKFLDKQEGKILCLKYDKTFKFIVTGSIDAIRVFDVEKGHALHKLSTGRSENNRPTIIWCLQVIDDFTIISGDSRGKLTFWDGKIGSQIESYQSHRADILTLAVSEDQKTLFCSGCDPNLISYAKVNMKDESQKWVKNIQRKAHDHDVKSLILFKEKLYSGGVDGYLACSFHPPKTLIKYPPFVQNNCVTRGVSARILLLQSPELLQLWKMASASEGPDNTGYYKYTDEPYKSLVHFAAKTERNGFGEKENHMFVCSSISSDGTRVVYSTRHHLRLLKIDYTDMEKLRVVLIPNSKDWKPCVRVAFTSDNKQLITATFTGQILAYSMEKLLLQQTIETNSYIKDSISHLLLSSDGKYMVVSDVEGNIVAWTWNNSWKFYCKLPKYECCPTAMSICPKNNHIVIAYSDHKVVEYNLHKKMYSDFSKCVDQEKIVQQGNKYLPIRNITFRPDNNNQILLQDDKSVIVIDKTKMMVNGTPDKKKMRRSNETLAPKKYEIRAIKEFQHLVHLDYLSDNEFVAVEVNPLTLLEKLPPCLKQATFGTK